MAYGTMDWNYRTGAQPMRTYWKCGGTACTACALGAHSGEANRLNIRDVLSPYYEARKQPSVHRLDKYDGKENE